MMDKSVLQLSNGILALQGGAAGAIKDTYGSVIAGVGSVLPQKVESVRPMVDDPASEKAFEEYKKYNAKSTLRADERRMWTGMIDRLTSIVMYGAASGLGVAAVTLAGGGWIPAIGIIAAAVAVSVVSYYFFQHPAIQAQSNKNMDVNDYQIKREAALIAKEIKAEFNRQGEVERVETVEKPANTVSAKTAAVETAIQNDVLHSEKRTWQQVVAEKETSAERQIH